MNELTLKKFEGDILEYYYKPEGRGEQGVITFDASKGKAEISKPAESDCSEQYDKMAKIAVEQIAKGKTIPKQYTQAWY